MAAETSDDEIDFAEALASLRTLSRIASSSAGTFSSGCPKMTVGQATVAAAMLPLVWHDGSNVAVSEPRRLQV